MAAQIAGNMSDDDKNSIENMDIEKMISHVTKSMFKVMGNGNNDNLLEEPESEESEPESKKPEVNNLSKTKDLQFVLDVSLEDLYLGKKKYINVKIKKSKGKEIVSIKKKLEIAIISGMKNKEQIIFKGCSDDIDGYTPGDIIITLNELPHKVFTRSDNDLIISKEINLVDVYSNEFYIKHLDSRILKIKNNNYLDNLKIKIPKEGMINKNSIPGDLYINFIISLPPKNLNVKLIKNFFENKKINSKKYDIEYLINNNTKSSTKSINSTNTSITSGSNTASTNTIETSSNSTNISENSVNS